MVQVKVQPRTNKAGEQTSWQIDYVQDGKRTRRKIPGTGPGTDKQAALEMARTFYAKLQDERQDARHAAHLVQAADALAQAGYNLERTGAAAQWKVSRAWSVWIDRLELQNRVAPHSKGCSASTLKLRRWSQSHMPDAVMSARICEIDAPMLERLQLELLKNLGPSSVHNVMGALQALLSWVIREYKALPSHPFASAQLLAVPKTSISYYTSEQRDEILAALPPLHEAVFGLAFYTGLRFGEVLGLHPEDKRAQSILVERSRAQRGDKTGPTKTRKTRMVPLCRRARHYWACALELRRQMLAQRGTPSPALFPSFRRTRRYMSFSQAGDVWRKVVGGLDVPSYKPSSTRHTFATLLISLGEDLYTVSRLLGHSTVTTTERFYADLVPNRLQEAVSALDEPEDLDTEQVLVLVK